MVAEQKFTDSTKKSEIEITVKSSGDPDELKLLAAEICARVISTFITTHVPEVKGK